MKEECTHRVMGMLASTSDFAICPYAFKTHKFDKTLEIM